MKNQTRLAVLPSAKGKLCGQLAAAVLVKICKVAAFQRILCAGKRDRETRNGEKLTAGGTVPQADLLLGYGGKGFLFFLIQKKRPDVGAQFRLRKLPDPTDTDSRRRRM